MTNPANSRRRVWRKTAINSYWTMGTANPRWRLLTPGTDSDLIGQVSSTRLAGGGAYSPYVGAVVDMAKILGNLHTASYQYIPALAVPDQDQLNLRLNNPPSFRKPMSVLVIGLPPVAAEQFPPPAFRQSGAGAVPAKTFAGVAGGRVPLVFSTELAHDLALHLRSRSGQDIDLPAIADVARGGFIVNTHSLSPGALDTEVSGTLRGYWGFQRFQGPDFRLRNAHPAKWVVPTPDASALIVGREDTLHLQSDAAVV